MKRHAFTMLELVFVIVVIGILAVLAMPRFDSDPLGRAAEQVASHIRYTQHLAIVNDVYDPKEQYWYRARPQIAFADCGSGTAYYYTVGSDKDRSTGHIGEDEAAIDPLTKKKMFWLNGQCTPDDYPDREESLLLTHTYGITVTPGANCATISFDSKGRPYNTFSLTNPYLGQLTNPCTITLTHATQGTTAIITIEPQTGYVSVSY